MANIESAKKRARQALVRKERNQQLKKAVRTMERKVRTAIAAKNFDDAKTSLREYMSAIDKASQKGKVHFKTAARKVSRLAATLNKAVNS